MTRGRKVCDLNVALQRMGNDAELLREFMETVRKDLPAIIGRMQAAVEGSDAALLQREVHSLRGTMVAFGAQAALSVAERLEQMAMAGDLSPAAETLQEMEREVARFDAALAAELKKR